MKRIKGIAMLVVIGIALTIMSCTGEGSCTSGSISITDLEDLGCVSTAFNLSVATLNDFELIRSQEDYERHIDVKCSPQIDWTTHDLIAGMVALTKGLASIDKNLTMDCSTKRLRLAVNIQTNLTSIAPMISYNALIPKLEDDQDVFVEVSVE